MLYHATSEDAAAGIQRHGFRCGSHGFAGGAIYFSRNPEAACRKYRNGRGDPDVLIECDVKLGKILQAKPHEVNRQKVLNRGYDSVTRPPFK